MTTESSDLNEKGREHKRTEERIYHLNVLLRAIRNVSQFITREKDRGRLLEGACKYLTEGGAYCNVWIAFLNESQRLVGLSPIPDKDMHSGGKGDEIGDWGKCAEKAMSQSGPYVVEDSQLICADCNSNKRCGGKKSITARLEYGGEILGLMMASIEGDRRIDREERSLFEEVAGDLAFALHGIDNANQELKREIVERERAEKVLKDSQALYSSLVENLPVHVLRKDLDGRFTFANKSFCDLIGKSLEEIAGKTDFDFYPEELAEKYRQDDQRVIDTGELFETIEVNKKDGDIRYVQVMKSAVRDAGGRIAGVQVIFWDVTERHKAEAALEQERYLLHALMDNLPHSIYFKDAKSCFIRINRALAKYFGLSDASEALGKTDSEFFADEHALQAKADEELVMRTGRPLLDKEEKETWPDGHETWVMSTKLPLYNEQGEIVGTFGISRDITEQRRAAEALRAAKEAAEVASRAKSDFLATMSHEIRTPMNGIIGMIDLLFGTNPTGQQRMYLELAGQSAETLLRLINDILDFSKIEAGKLELEFVGFKLRDTMGDTLQTLAGRASEKDLELTYHIPPEVPDDLVGDPGRFCQVIVNLVGNAIKFTEKGEIAVKVKLESLENHEARLHFAVSDTGPGVAPEKQRLIFEAFRQADSSMSRRFGGTGLGLAISSHLVEMMKGRMWLESMEGQGSTFHFTAVFSLREGALVEPGPGPVTLHGLRVLVVDDNKTNLLIMEEILKNWCMNPVVVENGQAALAEITRATETGESYSLVLLDGMMPGMDGFEVAEQIRKTSEVSETTIIMLSSARNLGDGARCRELGIDHCLMKPVKQSELLDSITSSLRVATADKPNESPPNKHRETTMCLNVLLVEDGLVNQKVAVNLLEQRRHKVTVANDGREAVDALEKESFDAVLMDIQMPVMDGFEATGIIRRREKVSGEHIPIIAMTAHAMEGDRERCLEAGMDAYIAKPIRAKALYDTLETTVERLCISQVKQNEPAGENEILDRSQILEQIGGSSEVLKEIVELFAVESKSLLKKMQDAIKNENPSGLQRAAHTLKGSVRVFGAERVASATLRLEKISESKNLNDAEDAWMELKRELERLVPMLDKLLKS